LRKHNNKTFYVYYICLRHPQPIKVIPMAFLLFNIILDLKSKMYIVHNRWVFIIIPQLVDFDNYQNVKDRYHRRKLGGLEGLLKKKKKNIIHIINSYVNILCLIL